MAARKFYSDVLFVQVVNILVKALWILAIDRAVQNLLPPESYGRYFSLLAFSILFIILLDLGINNMNSREVARDRDFFYRNFYGILKAKVLFSVFYLSVMFAMFFALGFSATDLRVLLPLAIMQIIISFNTYFRTNIAAHERFKLDGIFAVLDRTIVIIICGAMLLVQEWSDLLDIRRFVYIQVIGVGVSFVGLLIVNIRLLNQVDSKSRFQYSFVKELLKKTIPFALLAALMSLYTRIDAVMIKDILGDGEADRYAMGYRLLDALNMVAVLLSGILLPMFSARLKDHKQIRKLSSMGMRVLVLPSIVLVCLGVIYGPEIMHLMYPAKADMKTAETFSVLLACFLPISVVYIYGTLLTANRSLRFLNFLAAFSVIVNLILNRVFIVEYGILGAAWATLFTQSIFAMGCLFNAQRRLEALPSNAEWLRWAGFVITVWILAFGTLQLFDKSLVHIAILVLGSLLAALAFRLIGKDLLSLFLSKNDGSRD